jgi:transcriptional regulator with XRE-family HTH domain
VTKLSEEIDMEKKSIGSFIAALRKANGMTQQEVADRLKVSNKTVSKWERDESYPEITLIPVIAELFGVTSDEILRGERIPRNELAADGPDVKTDKRARWIIARNITRYKNMSFLSLALVFAGLVCMFTISYALYRPVLAFGIFLLLIIAGILLEIIQFNNTNMSIRDNDIFEDREELLKPLSNCRNRYTFLVIAADITAVIFSLPIVLLRDPYFVNSVILVKSYVALIPLLGIASSTICKLLYRIVKKNFAMRKEDRNADLWPRKRMNRMNLLHGGFLAAQYLIILGTKAGEAGRSSGYLAVAALFLPYIVIIISIPVFMVSAKDRNGKILFALAGLRNLLYGYIGLYLAFFIIFRYLQPGSFVFVQFPENFFIWMWAGLIVTVFYDLFRYKAYDRKQ